MSQKLKLDAAISSPQDLQALIMEVREYARWSLHNTIKKQVHAAKHITPPPTLSPATLATIKSWNDGEGHAMSRQSFDQLITVLDKYATQAPELTIILAAPATSGFKKSLVSWCRENISPQVLVSFEFNSALLGGMVVRFGSRVFDWSFRRAILANVNTFPETLRHESIPTNEAVNNV